MYDQPIVCTSGWNVSLDHLQDKIPPTLIGLSKYSLVSIIMMGNQTLVLSNGNNQ